MTGLTEIISTPQHIVSRVKNTSPSPLLAMTSLFGCNATNKAGSSRIAPEAAAKLHSQENIYASLKQRSFPSSYLQPDINP
jgi:hypothetical protein